MNSVRIEVPKVIFPSLLAILFCLLASPAWAGFLMVQDVSGESVGQANALTASGQRPSSQYHNAANISFIEGQALELGLTVYIADSTYENPQGVKTSTNVKPEYGPHLFTSFKINDILSLGLAVFPNYGIKLSWPEQWEGSHIAIRNEIKSMTVNPNISFTPCKNLHLAGGFDVIWASILTTRSLTLGVVPSGQEQAENQMRLEGSGWGFGGNFGIAYQPVDWARVGLGYRSTYDLKLDGKMSFDVSSPWAWRFQEQNYDFRIQAPHQLSLGARFWPHERVSLELDLWYFSWSLYETRQVDFEYGLYEGPEERRMAEIVEQDLSDGLQVALGVEGWATDNFVARLGVSYDSDVQPDKAVDPLQPDSQRLNVGIGFGGQWNSVANDIVYVDVAYMFSYMIPHELSTEAPLPGTFHTFRHVATLSLGYHFDRSSDPKEMPSPQPDSTVDEPEAQSDESSH